MNGGSRLEMEPKNLGGKSGDARFSTVSYLKKQHGVRECRTPYLERSTF
jgi:hypothetical protein